MIIKIHQYDNMFNELHMWMITIPYWGLVSRCIKYCDEFRWFSHTLFCTVWIDMICKILVLSVTVPFIVIGFPSQVSNDFSIFIILSISRIVKSITFLLIYMFNFSTGVIVLSRMELLYLNTILYICNIIINIVSSGKSFKIITILSN